MVGCAKSRRGEASPEKFGEDGNVLRANMVRPPPRLWDVFCWVLEIGSFAFNFVIITAYRLL